MLSDLFVFFLGNGERLWSSIEPFCKSLLSFREFSMSLTPLILTYCSYRRVFSLRFSQKTIQAQSLGLFGRIIDWFLRDLGISGNRMDAGTELCL